jgi:hypothetical protein
MLLAIIVWHSGDAQANVERVQRILEGLEIVLRI